MFGDDWNWIDNAFVFAIGAVFCLLVVCVILSGLWSDPTTSTISIKDKMYTDQSKIVIDSDERIYETNDIITYSNLMIGKSYIVNVSSNKFVGKYRIDKIVREV